MSNFITRIPRPFLSTAFAAAALALAAAATAPTMAHAGEELFSGTFIGQSDHITTGKVTIETEDGKTFLILHENFSLDGAPSPTIGFSKAGKFKADTEFTKLKMLKGKQRYELPAKIAAAAYDAVTIWCSKFSVPLGSARIGS